MIHQDELVLFGTLSRTHGKRGDLQCTVEHDLIEEADPEHVVLLLDNIFVPFRLLDWRSKNAESYILTLQDVDTEEAAQKLCGTEVYLLRRDLSDTPEEALTLDELVGFHVVDRTLGLLGDLQEVDESTINTLFLLDNGMVIPAHEDFIEGVDYDQRAIVVALPDGLVDSLQ